MGKYLNAYEFTRFNADFTHKLKAQAYDIDNMASKVLSSFGTQNPRQDGHYIECTDMFLELTMSGDKDEALDWMSYWMVNAIAYGIETKNLDWKLKFLAAYDIYQSLRH